MDARSDEIGMKLGLSKPALAILSIVFGVLIIIFPQLLAWLVGIFLIIWGIIQILRPK